MNMDEFIVELATLKDSSGIYYAFKQNLIEINDFENIPDKTVKKLENEGFLRKEVGEDYYKDLISSNLCDIYVAKGNNGKVLGFASIHKNKSDVRKFRSTLENLYINNIQIKNLLTNESSKFAYLDQISILPKYKRKGIASAIISKALHNLQFPIVAFIVEAPLANKASALWHEKCGFELVGTCDGSYKGKKFAWKIYLNWNIKK